MDKYKKLKYFFTLFSSLHKETNQHIYKMTSIVRNPSHAEVVAEVEDIIATLFDEDSSTYGDDNDSEYQYESDSDSESGSDSESDSDSDSESDSLYASESDSGSGSTITYEMIDLDLKEKKHLETVETLFGNFLSGNFEISNLFNRLNSNLSSYAFAVFGDKLYDEPDQFYGKVLSKDQIAIINWFWIYKCNKCYHWDWNPYKTDSSKCQRPTSCQHCKENSRKNRVISKVKQIDCTVADTCPVCIDEIEVGSSISRLPCSHSFHKECIVPWLKKNAENCPCCRTIISDKKMKPTKKCSKKRRRR